MTAAELEHEGKEAAEGQRGWSWAALVAALVLWIGGIPTFGMSVLLSPMSLFLTAVAWRRSAHDALFWIGFGLNVLLAVGLLSIGVALLTDEAAISWE